MSENFKWAMTAIAMKRAELQKDLHHYTSELRDLTRAKEMTENQLQELDKLIPMIEFIVGNKLVNNEGFTHNSEGFTITGTGETITDAANRQK